MAMVARPYDLPISPQDGRAPGRLGMMLLIATEASFFVYLLFSYFYLASMARGAWPPDGNNPALRLSLPNTIILIVSSGTMWWAEAGIRKGQQARLRIGLLVTLILGMLFLAIQGLEYSNQSFTPATHAYGSLFFTITGFHGAHVAAGLLMNIFVQARAWAGHFTATRHLALSNVALYWHFVDVVWIVVFLSLYITPRLG